MFKRIKSSLYSNNRVITTIFLLYPLLPIFAITGPFLSDFIFSLIALLTLIEIIRKRDFFLFKNKIILFFLFYYFFILTLSITSTNPLLSLESTLFYFRYFIFLISSYYIIHLIIDNVEIFINILLSIFLIILFDSLFQFIFGFNIFGFKSIYEDRISSFFNQEYILGSFISKFYPLLVGFIYLYNKSTLFNINKDYFFFTITLLTLIIILLSGERTAMGYFVLFVFAYSFIIFKNKIITLLIFYFTFFLLTLTIVLSVSSFKERFLNSTYLEFFNNQSDEKNEIYFFTKRHNDHINTAIDIFSDGNYYGIGPKLYRVFCDYEKYKRKYSCTTHPHNYFAQLLLETGILGALIYLIFIFLLIKHSYNIFKSNKEISDLNKFRLSILLIIIIINLPIFPSGNFFNNYNNVILFYIASFIMSFKKKL